MIGWKVMKILIQTKKAQLLTEYSITNFFQKKIIAGKSLKGGQAGSKDLEKNHSARLSLSLIQINAHNRRHNERKTFDNTNPVGDANWRHLGWNIQFILYGV